MSYSYDRRAAKKSPEVIKTVEKAVALVARSYKLRVTPTSHGTSSISIGFQTASGEALDPKVPQMVVQDVHEELEGVPGLRGVHLQGGLIRPDDIGFRIAVQFV